MRNYLLSENTLGTLRGKSIEVAILPWGATEAHNLHLPFCTDNFETEAIVSEAARLSVDKGAKVIVLPGIPYGVNTGQLGTIGTINLHPSTQFAILKDIADSLVKQGIYKLLIVNGHGGNDFRQMIREAGALYKNIFICTCNWYQAFENSEFFEKGGGHADEMETSLMLIVAPDLVLPLDNAGSGAAKQFRINSLNEKWAWAERKWSEVTKDTGIGDPSLATVGKGEKYFKAVTEKLSGLICGLSEADINDLYQ